MTLMVHWPPSSCAAALLTSIASELLQLVYLLQASAVAPHESLELELELELELPATFDIAAVVLASAAIAKGSRRSAARPYT